MSDSTIPNVISMPVPTVSNTDIYIVYLIYPVPLNLILIHTLLRPCLGYVPDGVDVMDVLGGRKSGNHVAFVRQMRLLERGRYAVTSVDGSDIYILWGRF